MNNLKTTLIALVALLAASTVSAGAYVVYENDVAFDKFDSLGSFDDTRSDIRLGTSVGIGYVEVGKFVMVSVLILAHLLKLAYQKALVIFNSKLRLKVSMLMIGHTN
jgi:hypothetical protein